MVASYLRPYMYWLCAIFWFQNAVCKVCSIFFYVVVLFSLAFLSSLASSMLFLFFSFLLFLCSSILGYDNALRKKSAIFVRLLCVHFIKNLFLNFVSICIDKEASKSLSIRMTGFFSLLQFEHFFKCTRFSCQCLFFGFRYFNHCIEIISVCKQFLNWMKWNVIMIFVRSAVHWNSSYIVNEQ